MRLMSSPALCAATGATYRQIDYWVTQGWLTPLAVEGKSPKGSGHRRVFTDTHVGIVSALLLATDRKAMAAHVSTAITTGHADLGHGLTLTYTEAEVTQ